MVTFIISTIPVKLVQHAALVKMCHYLFLSLHHHDKPCNVPQKWKSCQDVKKAKLTYAGPIGLCEGSGSSGRGHLVGPFQPAASGYALPEITSKACVLPEQQRHAQPTIHFAHFKLTNLLIIDRVSSQICKVHKLHVQRSKLSQDATTSRGPAPVTAHTTEKEEMRKSG